ncbi:MAG: restriction endonuclease subunit S [Acidimicrobiia bacterium]|nr:restriction endonuclease subunit S [Acidimicrobiia bacterium]
MSEGWVPIFPPDSTLVVGIGATAGRVCHNVEASTGNQQMTCITPNARVVPRFLSWQLWARAEELRATAPYTTLPIINNDFLRSILIAVPAWHLQQEMVDRIDQAADRILAITAKLQAHIHLLTERRKAIDHGRRNR